jgi:hypothetical protein
MHRDDLKSRTNLLATISRRDAADHGTRNPEPPRIHREHREPLAPPRSRHRSGMLCSTTRAVRSFPRDSERATNGLGGRPAGGSIIMSFAMTTIRYGI